MSVFAVVDNELVVNIIEAENQQIADEVLALTLPNDIAVELDNNTRAVGIGWSYKDGKFEPPYQEETIPKPIT
jgi:hypothetical protein